MTTSDRTYPLAVFVPVLGTASETFVRRHVEDLLPGGTVVVTRRLASEAAAGWSVDVPTLFLDPLADDWGGAREQEAVASFLRSRGVRAVLLEFLDTWVSFLPVVRSLGMRCLAHAHGYDVSQRLREEYWRSAYLAYRDVDAVVTVSNVTRDRLVSLGLPAERVTVIPCGVDPAPEMDRGPRNRTHVVVVGRLVPKKQPVASIEACVAAARLGADLRVSVIGDGPLIDEVRSAATSASIQVDLLGARPHAEVLAMMRAADIFCQHSIIDPATGDEEGVPVAILEAMAQGLPVVATRHAGIPDAVTDGVSGFLVDEGDVDAMADHLRDLATDPALRQRMGAAGRERAHARFMWSTERQALLQLLLPENDAVHVAVGSTA